MYLSAVMLALSFWTKQTGLLFAMGLGLYLLFTAGRRVWPFGLVVAVLTLLPYLWLDRVTGGWFSYYTIRIASVNPFEAGRLFRYITGELFGVMSGLSIMALGAGLLALRRAGLRLLREQPWLLVIGLMAVVSGVGRASVGGNLNHLMQVYPLLCLAPALLWREWQAQLDLLPHWRTGLLVGLVIAQFALGIYYPPRYVPTPAMRESGDRLVARLAATEGEVLVMMHPYYAWLAGKEPSAQLVPLWHGLERGSLPLPPDLVTRLEQQYYAIIISDNSLFETEPELVGLLETYYFPAETLSPAESPPAPTGMAARPQQLYRPRPDD